MNNFRNVMRYMRAYTAKIEKNLNSRTVLLEKEDVADKKGSPWYDRYAAEVDRKIEAERVRLATEAQKELVGMITTMRENVSKRITKAPTADMVNTLSLLGMMDNVNPTEIKGYAEQMADCPLALKVLSQIAEKNNIRIDTPDTEEMMRAVDVIEGNIANYLQNFHGDASASASVKMLHDLYFQADDHYSKTGVESAAAADTAFWQNIVQIGTPAMLDDTDGKGGAITAKYFFSGMDGLLEFIQNQTQGLEGSAREDKINEILSNCPGQYGAAYRFYLANGQKVPLLEEGEQLDPADNPANNA